MTLKLASVKADLDRESAGDWIEYPDWPGVAFKVSSLHKPAYGIASNLLVQKLVRRNKGVQPSQDVLAPEIGKLYCQHILHEWRGFDVPYTPEAALATLTDPAYRQVVAAVEWCAGQVSQTEAEFLDETEKNSAAPSAKA